MLGFCEGDPQVVILMLDRHDVVDSLQAIQDNDKARELFNLLKMPTTKHLEMNRRTYGQKTTFFITLVERIFAISSKLTGFAVLLRAACYQSLSRSHTLNLSSFNVVSG